MALAKYFLVLVLVTGHVLRSQWVNKYGEDAVLDCQGNQYLTYIGSVHKNSFQDRIWQFRCSPAPGEVYDCDWSSYLNDFDGVLNFSCPGNWFVNGLMSYFDSYHKDRRFLVKCCGLYPRTIQNCGMTSFVNDWDREMKFAVPEGKCIKGLYSVHINAKEDRRWKFNVCDLV